VSSDREVIRRVVDAFERSDWAEIDVRAGSLRIHLSTQSSPAPATAAPVDAGSAPEPADEPTTRPAPEIPPGAHVVVSPSPGIFWRSPLPGAPPFADTGQRVEPDSTVCIIEVMKLMSHIKSGVAGTVVGVFADNGSGVERDDPLFAIAAEE
jgi:biotin carboxyl carrier protein